MKLEKDKIIEAAKAFNDAKSFDEFRIKIDLLNIKLEDFEKDYYKIASIHSIFLNMITCNGKLSSFSAKAYMKLDPHKIPGLGCIKIHDHFRLPLWFDKDELGDVSMMMPDKTIMKTSYSQELVDDLAKMGIDANIEIANTLMIDLCAK